MRFRLIVFLVLCTYLITHAQNTDVAETESPPVVLSMPLDGNVVVTSKYGYRKDPKTRKKRFHHGIDLRCNRSEVKAMLFGRVKAVGYNKNGYGRYIVLSHDDFEVTYAHLHSVVVKEGEIVYPNTTVAVSGNTGRSTGPHLHMEVKYKGKRVDPMPLLQVIMKHTNMKPRSKTKYVFRSDRVANRLGETVIS